MAATIWAYSTIYQFKITLNSGSKSKVWRRIQVPETFNFWDLHTAIQDAMQGWEDNHLHQFEMIDLKTGKMVRIGIPYEDKYDADLTTIPEKTTKIAEYFLTAKAEGNYRYDFSMNWEHNIHNIILENIFPAIAGIQYPQCVGGELACPPETEDGVESPEYRECHSKDFDPKSVKFDNSEKRWQGAFK